MPGPIESRRPGFDDEPGQKGGESDGDENSLMIWPWSAEDADPTQSPLLGALLRTLSAALSGHPDGIVLLEQRDERLAIRYVNKAFETMTGRRCDEVLGEGLDVLSFEESETSELEGLRNALRRHAPAGVKLRCRTPAGSIFWCRMSISPMGRYVDADDGKNETSSLYLLSLIDVTEALKHRLPLEEYRYLVGVLDSSPDVICVIDENDLIQDVNNAITPMLGWKPSEMVGKPLLQLIDSGFHEEWLSALTLLRGAQPPAPLRVQHVAANGEMVPVRWSFSTLHDRQMIVCVGRDCREQEASEDRFIHLQTRTNSILDSITDCFISLDRDWRFVYANSAAAQLAGMPIDALIGTTIWQSLPQLNPNRFLEASASLVPAVFMEHLKDIERWFEVRLYPHLEGMSALFQDVTQRQREGALIDHLIGHDSLTNLTNRPRFLASLEAQLPIMQPALELLNVLFVDLDRFKDLNDAFGHATGDRVLCELAVRFRALVTHEGQLARLGGDEFVFHLVGTKEVAETLARRIIEVASEPFKIDGAEECSVGASVGIASYPEGGQTAEELLRSADMAMYEAKAAGRGVYRLFDPPLARKKINETQIRRDLRHAAFRDELRLFYQPTFSLKSGQMTGAEALLRWQHPTRGLLGAANFISLAEESQLITAMGRWTVDEVCRQIAIWLKAGLQIPRISINLDGRHFSDPSLPRLVGDLLARYDVGAEYLGLEITEGMLIPDPVGAAQVLRTLHDMGIRISLDDFGTGYSNLGYLQKFPIDTLKIDRSFIQHVVSENENNSARLTQSIIALGSALGLKTLAEGVETVEQLEFLNRHGCDSVQGYLFSQAVPASTFAGEFLQRLMPMDHYIGVSIEF